MEREQELRELTRKLVGMHFTDPVAEKIIDSADWEGYYPLVDASDGQFTGAIVGVGEEGYLLISDDAVVAEDDLSPTQRKTISDGYVTL